MRFLDRPVIGWFEIRHAIIAALILFSAYAVWITEVVIPNRKLEQLCDLVNEARFSLIDAAEKLEDDEDSYRIREVVELCTGRPVPTRSPSP